MVFRCLWTAGTWRGSGSDLASGRRRCEPNYAEFHWDGTHFSLWLMPVVSPLI
jgi:hypothetical protein